MTTQTTSKEYAPIIEPRLRLLSPDQLLQIHLASLEVLEEQASTDERAHATAPLQSLSACDTQT